MINKKIAVTALSAILLTTSVAASAANLMVRGGYSGDYYRVKINGSLSSACQNARGNTWVNMRVSVRPGDKVQLITVHGDCNGERQMDRVTRVPLGYSLENYWTSI